MAIQTSMFTLKGRLGDLIHSNYKGKDVTRRAAKEVRMTAESKKSGSEFGAASAAGCLLRSGFYGLLRNVGDDELYNRLNSLAAKIIRTGPIAMKGRREIMDGDLALLKGCEFNRHAPVDHLFKLTPEVTFGPQTYLSVTLPEFSPLESFHAPPNMKTAILKFASGAFDFQAKNGQLSVADDLEIPLSSPLFEGGTLDFPIDESEGKVFVTAMAILLKFHDGGISGDKRYRAGQIIHAVTVKDGQVVQFQYPEPVIVPEAEGKKPTTVAWKLKGK